MFMASCQSLNWPPWEADRAVLVTTTLFEKLNETREAKNVLVYIH